MIGFEHATPEQKKRIEALLKQLLAKTNIAHNYRIEINSRRLILRESSSNPPTERTRKIFLGLLALLKKETLIGEVEKVKIRVDQHNNTVSAFVIKHINDILLAGKTTKPRDVDDSIWSQLPKEIKSYWHNFSSALQQHIITCTNSRLSELLAQISEQKQCNLGDTFISPIGLSVPLYPVRLSTAKASSAVGSVVELKAGFGGEAKVVDPKADANKVYDLLEVLAIQDRKHPITREPFLLSDIQPAADASNELVSRAKKIIDKEVPIPSQPGLPLQASSVSSSSSTQDSKVEKTKKTVAFSNASTSQSETKLLASTTNQAFVASRSEQNPFYDELRKLAAGNEQDIRTLFTKLMDLIYRNRTEKLDVEHIKFILALIVGNPWVRDLIRYDNLCVALSTLIIRMSTEGQLSSLGPEDIHNCNFFAKYYYSNTFPLITGERPYKFNEEALEAIERFSWIKRPPLHNNSSVTTAPHAVTFSCASSSSSTPIATPQINSFKPGMIITKY